jgi:hypothetical protein
MSIVQLNFPNGDIKEIKSNVPVFTNLRIWDKFTYDNIKYYISDREIVYDTDIIEKITLKLL